jgi:DHA2 family multidrug resistance protein-like MFS transporter
MLTLGYAIAIVAFIRVGEKLLQRFGARRPMIWGSLIVGLSVALLMPTNLFIGQYKVLAVVAYTLFGLGLAFYATPSTDAALSNLPDDQAGSGAGIYKMASSLGASFGVAISAAIFTALSANHESIQWLSGMLTFAGRQDNVQVRQAALVALGFNLIMVVAAIVSIMLTVPRVPENEEFK